ncbi:unnamed protein product, partial [Medioppia subpectinata]
YNDGRIVGGTDAKADQASFQVSIFAYTGWFDWMHICGGSLVGRRSVVTAAHCCDSFITSELEARYDGLDYRTLKTINKVTKIDTHEGYNSQSYDWDYCVLTLRDDIVKSPTVQTIELATSVPPPGSAAHLTGWGVTTESGSSLKGISLDVPDVLPQPVSSVESIVIGYQ